MKQHIAIVGATGAVGQMMIKVLEQLDFPLASLRLFASTSSVGKQLIFKGQPLSIEKLTPDSFYGIDIVLGAVSNELSVEITPWIKKAKAIYIDNSSAYRLDASVPLIVPEVNPLDIVTHQGIIANPNCSTILVATALAPLMRNYPIDKILAATYQAVSGAGQAGLDELINQTRAFAHHQPLVNEVFDQPILFNVLPQIGDIQDHGYTQEEVKMEAELRKIFNQPTLKVSTTCVRVPVLQSHSVALTIDSKQDIALDKAIAVLSQASGIKLIKDQNPTPLLASNQDLVLVGRIRKDTVFEHGLSLFISGDQLRKGAATNAIQIAQLLIK